MSEERPSAQVMAQELVDGLLEAWIARFPRLTERGLRPRLSAALRALVGDVRQFSADDFDDFDVMAAALVEHFIVARSVSADLQGSPNMLAVDSSLDDNDVNR